MSRTASRVLLTASALVSLAIGLAATFAPAEVAAGVGVNGPAAAVVFQLLGALCLGIGFINWTSRRSLIGGIYGRPLALGNTLHYVVGALALAKAGIGGPVLLTMAAIYGVFALGFLSVLFGPSPVDG